MLGTVTSEPEVTNISRHGLWIIVDDHEHFLPFDNFPWFKSETIDAILNVERPSSDHLYWPDLDVDLNLRSIEEPERYPLIARTGNEIAP